MPRRTATKHRNVNEEKFADNPKLEFDEIYKNPKNSAQKENIPKNIPDDRDEPVHYDKKESNKKLKDTSSDRRRSLRSCSSEKNLGLLETSSIENSNANSRASSDNGSPREKEKRRLKLSSRSLSQLGSISETDLTSIASGSSETITVERVEKLCRTQSAGRTPRKLINRTVEVQADDTNVQYQTMPQRDLRTRVSEPTDLTTKEGLQFALNSTPRRQSGPSSGSGRSGRMKKSPNPSNSTRAFFESMALTVSTFPLHLQAAVKVHICKIVSETEYELSSPTAR